MRPFSNSLDLLVQIRRLNLLPLLALVKRLGQRFQLLELDIRNIHSADDPTRLRQLSFEIFLRRAHARVKLDRERLAIGLSIHDEFDRVVSRSSQWALWLLSWCLM